MSDEGAIMKSIQAALDRKRNDITRTLDDIAVFCGNKVTVEQVERTSPSSLLERLQQAGHFRPEYDRTATKLRDFLIAKITNDLNAALDFVHHDNLESGKGNESQMPPTDASTTTTAPQGLSSGPIVMNGGQQDFSHDKGAPHSSKTDRSEVRSLEDCENITKKIDAFTPYFPSDVYTAYQPLLIKMKNTIECIKQEHLSRIKEAARSDVNECGRTLRMFNSYCKKGDFENMKECSDQMNKTLEGFVGRMVDDLKCGKLHSVLTVLLPSYPDWRQYVDQLTEWNREPHKYKHFLVRTFYRVMHPIKVDVERPISLFRNLHHRIREATTYVIDSIHKNTLQLPAMEVHFDGLVSLLKGDAGTMRLVSSQDVDASMRAIMHIGGMFVTLGRDVSRLLSQTESALSNAGDMAVGTDVVSGYLSTANNSILLLKKCMPLFQKVEALCRASNVLRGDYPSKLSGMDLLTHSHSALTNKMNAIIEMVQRIAKPSLLNNKLLDTPNASDRNSFYRRVQFALTLLIQWDSCQAIAQECVNLRSNEEGCRDRIKFEISSIGDAADRLLDSTDYQTLGILYDNLRSINENLADITLKDRASGRMKTIDSLFFGRIELMKNKGWLNEEEWSTCPFDKNLYEKVGKELINMKAVTLQIALYKKRIDVEYIDILLRDYKVRTDGAAGTSFFLGLSLYLSAIRTSSEALIASLLLNDHSAFYGHKLLLRNEKVLRFTVDELLSDIKGDDEKGGNYVQLEKGTKDRLKLVSGLFEGDYWSLVGSGLTGDKDLQTVLAGIITETKYIASRVDIPQKLRVRKLMALVFAYWTLNGSEHYQYTIASQGNTLTAEQQAASVKKNSALLQPHSGQIVGILRLFGLDAEDIPDKVPHQPGLGNVIPTCFTFNLNELRSSL